jgi:hypothetical protein
MADRIYWPSECYDRVIGLYDVVHGRFVLTRLAASRFCCPIIGSFRSPRSSIGSRLPYGPTNDSSCRSVVGHLLVIGCGCRWWCCCFWGRVATYLHGYNSAMLISEPCISRNPSAWAGACFFMSRRRGDRRLLIDGWMQARMSMDSPVPNFLLSEGHTERGRFLFGGQLTLGAK